MVTRLARGRKTRKVLACDSAACYYCVWVAHSIAAIMMEAVPVFLNGIERAVV
jgi:hypothetical protein